MHYQRALVTGATSGLGRGIACALARLGIPLMVTGRNREALHQLSEELSSYVPVGWRSLDLSLLSERRILEEWIEQEKPDLLINAAGYGLYGLAHASSPEEQLGILRVNLEALYALSLTCANSLIQEGRSGVIYNIASAAAYLPMPYAAAYGASKAAVLSLSQALDAEWRPLGVRVLCVCPGQVKTAFQERAAYGRPIPHLAGWEMDPDRVVHLMMRQIDRLCPLQVIDWRVRMGLFFAKLLPQSWVRKRISAILEARSTTPK